MKPCSDLELWISQLPKDAQILALEVIRDDLNAPPINTPIDLLIAVGTKRLANAVDKEVIKVLTSKQA